MHPNPVLKKLGFQDSDRVVILHADDIGMCQASAAAFAKLWDFGLISSGATMAPCAWLPQVAAFCGEHPGVDLGIHITLNCEYDFYRWRPLSTCDPASGLLDEEGYQPRSPSAIQEKAGAAAVQVEMEAQVRHACRAGIQPTHIDTHMGTVAHPKFIPGYIQTALKFHLPVMVLRQDKAGYQAIGMDDATAEFAANFVALLEEQGIPLLDHLTALPLDPPDQEMTVAARIDQAKAALSALPPGITHFIIHPALDTPELRAITPDWPCRVADFLAFSSEELRSYIKNSGIQVIGYRALLDVMHKVNFGVDA